MSRYIFSLRVLLPVLVLLLMLSTMTVSYVTTSKTLIEDLQKRLLVQHRDSLVMIQGTVLEFMRRGAFDALDQLVSSFSANSDMLNMVIVDGGGKIVASNHFAEKNRFWSSLSLGGSDQVVNAVRQANSLDVMLDEKALRLDGYASLCSAPVAVSESVLRTQDCGFVFYRMDMKHHLESAISLRRQTMTYEVIGMLLGGIFLLLVIDFLVTRRVKRLVEVIRRFSFGDRGIRSHCWSQDELKWLGESVNHLLDTIVNEEQLSFDRQQKLDTLFNTVNDAIVVVDGGGIIKQINPATESMFGYGAAELLGENISMLILPRHGEWQDHYFNNYLEAGDGKVVGVGRRVTARRKGGEQFSVELSVSEMMVKGCRMMTGIIRDVTDKKFLEDALVKANEALLSANEMLEVSSSTDSLTGLPNRRHFDERLEEELRRNGRNGVPISVLLCDVDFFKFYNDHYGHQEGDNCLRVVGEVMRSVFQRAGELPARYGGEEFAVILPGNDVLQAENMALRLVKAMRNKHLPHEMSDVAEVVTLSVGVATFYPKGSSELVTPEELLKKADEGLYAAKKQGRNCVVVGSSFDESRLINKTV